MQASVNIRTEMTTSPVQKWLPFTVRGQTDVDLIGFDLPKTDIFCRGEKMSPSPAREWFRTVTEIDRFLQFPEIPRRNVDRKQQIKAIP